MRRLTLAVIAAALPFLTGEALGAQACGRKVHREADETRTWATHYLASCEGTGSCRALTYLRNPDAKLGWSHRLAFLRTARDAPWVIEFNSADDEVDVAAGFSLAIDYNAPVQVPAEVIETPRAVNDYYFKPDINEILVKDLAAGANVVWAYTSAGSRKPVSAGLSLTGLRRAMRWIDCMQAK